MKRLARDVGLKLLARRDRTVTPRTEPAELSELVRRLHPRLSPTSLVRLGPPGDGGYLIPDDLDGVTACFSPGVSRQSGFEEACAERGMSVFLADASVEGPAISHERFHFLRKFVGATTNDEFTTLDDWVTASVPESDGELLLQIDVEGYEYEVFLSASDALLRRFRIMVAEFHRLDALWDARFFGLASRVFTKILQTHVVVHAHPNNCCGSVARWGIDIPRMMEFTFLRSDRVGSSEYAKVFPHPLDRDNVAINPSLPLPKSWHVVL